MRRQFLLTLLFLLAGCQSGGSLGISNGAGPDLATNDPSALSEQHPTTLNATPPTTTSTPIFGATPYVCRATLCFHGSQVSDPTKCPGNDIFIKGEVWSDDSTTDFEKVELVFSYSGGPLTTYSHPILLMPSSGKGPNLSSLQSITGRPQGGPGPYGAGGSGSVVGEYSTFLGAKPGDLVKISAHRTDHPGEAGIEQEIQLSSTVNEWDGYDGPCPTGYADQNPVLQDLPSPKTPNVDPNTVLK